jgi:hypothetical protein
LLFWLSKTKAALTNSEEIFNGCQGKGPEDFFKNKELIKAFLEKKYYTFKFSKN